MNNLCPAILRTGTLSALAGVALISNAQAGSITQNVNIPVQTTDLAKTFTFNQFNPALGTLDSVELSVAATGNFAGNVTNNASGAETFDVTEQTALTFTGPDATSVTSNLSATQSYLGLTPGTTAAFGPFTPGPGAVTKFVPSANFGTFIGTGLLTSTVGTVSGQSIIGGGGNIAAALTTKAGAEATLIYTYHTPTTSPVPEPGAWASMSIGVLGLMALGLKARKKNLQF